MCIALDVPWCVVKGSVMTDGTSGTHNNEVHARGTDSSSAVESNDLFMYI